MYAPVTFYSPWPISLMSAMQEANITSYGVMTQLELIVPQSQKTDVIQRAGHEDILLPFSGEIQLRNS